MALSETGAQVLLGSINAVGSYFAGKSVAKEAKKTAAAQRKLYELQQEEQRLRNLAVKMTLDDQNRSLPFAISNPSLPSDAYAGNVLPAASAGGSTGPGATVHAGAGSFVVLALAGLALAALFFTKAQAV